MANWHSRNRNEKLAAVLWKNLVDEPTRKEMDTILRGEGKKPKAVAKLLSHSERGCCSPLDGRMVRKP
jgi:hypothetical protein